MRRAVRLARGVVAVLALLVVCVAPSARADEVVLRGNYYRDRNTRVIQPEVDITKDLPTGTTIGAHYLLDTITSASQAAGVILDHPFTELRNEVGASVGQRIGPSMNTVSYSYSSESDYWAHTLSVASTIDFFQKNSTLGLVTTYGSDVVALRQAPSVYVKVGGLQTFGFIASWSQVLSRTVLGVVEYDLNVSGFGSSKGLVTGSPDASTGFQSNVYRSVNLSGAPARESVPFQRVRQSFAAALHFIVPLYGRLVPYVAFRPSYRYYFDDWAVKAHTVELRTFVPVGPVEFRLSGRYYTQTQASFYASDGDVGGPNYTGDAAKGLPCTSCYASVSHKAGALFYTADPKLSAFSSMFVELRLALKLAPIFRFSAHAIPRWLAEGRAEISYGHYFNDRYAYSTFGSAEVAGLTLAFPL
jgi:hypothetical protein